MSSKCFFGIMRVRSAMIDGGRLLCDKIRQTLLKFGLAESRCRGFQNYLPGHLGFLMYS